jgi:hypothetical protein
VKNLHLHDLRAEAGSQLLESGVNLRDVRDAVGHSSTTMTSTYLRGRVDSLREAFERRRLHLVKTGLASIAKRREREIAIVAIRTTRTYNCPQHQRCSTGGYQHRNPEVQAMNSLQAHAGFAGLSVVQVSSASTVTNSGVATIAPAIKHRPTKNASEDRSRMWLLLADSYRQAATTDCRMRAHCTRLVA